MKMSLLVRVLLGIDFVSIRIYLCFLFNILKDNDVTETQALPMAYENHVIKDLIVGGKAGVEAEDVYKEVKKMEIVSIKIQFIQTTVHQAIP
jgi:hypothetical protein